MSNPHPHCFYRFNTAWNSGFYPQNVTVTNQLNDIYAQIGSWLPGFYPGKTIYELKAGVKSIVEPFNQFPILGNFRVTSTESPDPPYMDFYIYVDDADLYKIDASQRLIIVGQYFISNNLISSCTLTSFTVGAYSGTFDPTFVPAEQLGIDALGIFNNYGSAIFPNYYDYDTTSSVAISYLARASNLKLDTDGSVFRMPISTIPKLNSRRFTLPALSANDKYAISLMERIIKASIGQTDVVAINNEYNSWQFPWIPSLGDITKGYDYASGTYSRVQITLKTSNDRIFTLVGLYDTKWTWQRFINDIGNDSINSFLTNYSDSSLLPYNPNSGSRYIYLDTYYDFDLVDFEPECYVSPEFYPMPAIPGDNWQFNVPRDLANLIGVDSVLVGLFQEDGGLVQKIGSAEIASNKFIGYGMYNLSGVSVDYSTWWNTLYESIYAVNFSFVDCNGSGIGDTIAQIPANALPDDSFSTFKSVVEGLNWPDGISVLVTQDNDGKVIFEFVISSKYECYCGITAYTFYTGSNNIIRPEVYQEFISSKQFYASCTIPAVADGCYRLGLYNEPSTTCDMTFTETLSGSELTGYLSAVNGTFGSANPYISFKVGSFVYVYNVTSNSTTAEDIATWCNANIPGMAVVAGEGTLSFTWQIELPCDSTYIMVSCISDDAGASCYVTLWESTIQECACGTTNYLYSLSNIIKIDRSDCFSTMLEFWSDDNSVAEGYEYFNGWKQRIRLGLNGGGAKPVIDESLYRQSNGVHKRPQNKQDLSLDLHTDFLDEETQLALVDATRHPYLVWNQKPIFVKGDLDVATIQDFTTQSSFETLAQVKFQALLQGFQPRNSSCLNC